MSKLDWIKDLVRAEKQMEESGIVDFTAGFDEQVALKEETVDFLLCLKDAFVEYASAFNQMRGLTVGGVKIYGISKTQADFMLFRNGYKLIFSFKKPGTISIRFTFQGAGIMPGAPASDTSNENALNEDVLEARWGAFGEISWAYRGNPVKLDYLVRYYLSRFIKESAK